MVTTGTDSLLNDEERLGRLRALGILDTPPDQAFEHLVALATEICDAPVALVSLVDAERQWFKARIGFEPGQTGLDRSVCRHGLGESELLQIPDLSKDPRTKDNPLVTGPPFVRFYAGAPLRTKDGLALGALCILDHVPRPNGLSDKQAVALKALAGQAMNQIELGAALVMQHADRDHALSEAARLDALIATQQRVAAADADLKSVFQAVVDGALQAVPTALGAVVEVQDGEDLVYDTVSGNLRDHQGLRLPLERTLSGWAIRQERPILCDDTNGDPRVDPATMRLLGIASMIVVPVMRRGRAIGALKIESDTVKAFSHRDFVMAQMLGSLVASAYGSAAEATSRHELHEAEQRYRRTFESITDFAIIVTDREGRVTEWNTGAERIIGWTAEEICGDDLLRFFVPEDRAADRPRIEMETALRDGRASDERWHLRKDGSRFYASGSLMPLRADDGGHLGFIKVLRDSTVQRRNEDSLLATQEQLHLAVEAGSIGIFDYDLLQDKLRWDARTRDFFGLDPAAPVDYETFLSALHPDDRPWVDSAVKATLSPEGEGGFDVEYRAIGLQNGRERWIAAKGQAFFANGRARRFIGTVRDITENKRAAEALQETEERYRLASRATNDAIWDWDQITNHVRWNEALYAAYGYDPETVEPTGDWWIAHIHPDDRARIDRSIHGVLDGEGTDWTDEYRFQRADGSYADILDRGQVIRNPDGRPVRMIGAMLDLTRVQKAEAAFRESQRLLEIERGLLQAVVQQAPVGISIAHADGRVQINTRLAEMLAGGGDGAAGRLDDRDAGADPDPIANDPTFRALRHGETLIAEPLTRIHPATGEVRRWEASSTPVRDAQGGILAAVSLILDVEDRYRAEERRAILNRELSHRLKNTLAIVASISTQTLRTAPDLASARKILAERIGALSHAHDVLLTDDSDAAPVDEIVRATTGLLDGSGRVVAGGPVVMLGPKASLTLTLILHELTTNAHKYGALSVPNGRIVVSWRLDAQPDAGKPALVFEWREEGGPPVRPPSRRSFGTRLIEMGLSSGGAAKLAYEPTGLVCTIVAPMADIQKEAG